MNKWIEWNRNGFIPGPTETEQEFEKRIAFCEQIESELVKRAGADLPFDVGDEQSKIILQESLKKTEELYGIEPHWVPLFFSNYQLSLWHGGCAWIFQLDDETPMAAFLQLRALFRQKETYLGLYHRQELIAHELAHVGRMMYQEPKFEEVFAYRSSDSRLRRWLGPIVQSSRESLFFMGVLGLFLMTYIALGTLNASLGWPILLGMESVLVGLVVLALGRLYWRQRTYQQCLGKLQQIYQNPQTAAHLLYRLRDHEIQQFAIMTLPDIITMMRQEDSFRWQFLRFIYPC